MSRSVLEFFHPEHFISEWNIGIAEIEKKLRGEKTVNTGNMPLAAVVEFPSGGQTK